MDEKQPPADSRVAPPLPRADQLLCDVCGQRAFELHCKIICPNCGYIRDCSDP